MSLFLQWVDEDCPSFDVGGFVVGDREDCSILLCKSSGVLAGVPFVNEVFRLVGCDVRWGVREGTFLDASGGPVRCAEVRGPCRGLLLGERLSLNLLSRASGIATQAREIGSLVKSCGWHGEVVATRKTTPGFRLVEKYALLVSGVVGGHRMDLSSMTMLKDNHVWATGSISSAVAKARAAGGFALKIEVEARSLEEATEAAESGAEVVMLDNYDPERAAADAAALKAEFPHLTIEVSGGITKETIKSFCNPHVDVISMGKLTQGYPTLDFSLKLAKGLEE